MLRERSPPRETAKFASVAVHVAVMHMAYICHTAACGVRRIFSPASVFQRVRPYRKSLYLILEVEDQELLQVLVHLWLILTELVRTIRREAPACDVREWPLPVIAHDLQQPLHSANVFLQLKPVCTV